MQSQSSYPAYPHYTQEEWHKIEQSVIELPEQSPLIPVLQDYMDLLDKLKVVDLFETLVGSIPASSQEKHTILQYTRWLFAYSLQTYPQGGRTH